MDSRQFFGTDGIRAKVGSPKMTPEFMLKLGWAIGSILSQKESKKPAVLIGRDTRISGEMLQSALVSGLLSSGCDVVLGGVLPTPIIAFLTNKLPVSAGLIISASHNPYYDNGVKCIGPDGMKLPDEWELVVERYLQQDCSLVSQSKIGAIQMYQDCEQEYLDYCHALFESKLNLSNIKIVLDCANGATSGIATKLFEKFNAVVKTIHDKPSGININEQCGATHVDSLIKTVLAEKADCGLAFDGDGDRLIMVDHQGEVVDGDEMLGVLAVYGDYKGVIGTLMSNLGLEKAMAENNVAFKRAAVGDRYVLAGLLEKGWRLGGEASGHVINLDYSQTGDGMLTGLQILKAMQDSALSLHDLKQIVKKRPQILINVPVENPKQFSKIDAINEAVAKAQADLGESGRVLLRASGTESCVRVMVEANDDEQGRVVAQSLADVVQSSFSLI